MSTKKLTEVPATVPLPSADLLNYRMDQTDNVLKQILDKLDGMAGKFLTREEANLRIQDCEVRHDTTEKKVRTHDDLINQIQGAIKFMKGAIAFLAMLGTIVGGLWWIKG